MHRRVEGPGWVGRSLLTEPHSLPVQALQPQGSAEARLKGPAGLAGACRQSLTACQSQLCSLFTLCWL